MKFSKFISYFFHPINFSIIGSFLYFLFLPKYIYKPQEYIILTVIFIGTYIFPLIFIFLLKRFGMIYSYQMTTIEERKFPTILFTTICFIISNWLFKTDAVDLLALFYLGYGVCLALSYIFLLFHQKISLHSVASGGLIGFLIYFSYYFQINIIWVLFASFILAGIIGSARLKIKAHKLSEVILGFLLGLLCQLGVFIAYSM